MPFSVSGTQEYRHPYSHSIISANSYYCSLVYLILLLNESPIPQLGLSDPCIMSQCTMDSGKGDDIKCKQMIIGVFG